MKRLILKAVLFAVAVTLMLTFAASCEFLYVEDSGCLHESINDGTCIKRASCNICGATVGDFGEHDYTASSVAPTCTDSGLTVTVCKHCGDRKENPSAPAIGHSFGEWVITVHPSVSDAGTMERQCSRCGFIETDIVEAHEHDIVIAEAREADCDLDGWAEYEYCTLCEYTTRELIPAIGHAWGEYISGGNGTHSIVCANNPAHLLTEPCSGGTSDGNTLPICSLCGVEYAFAARPGNSTYGYYELGGYDDGENMQKLYRDLTAVAESFFYSTEDVTPDSDRYVIGKFAASDYSLPLESALAVWKIFYVSSPAYYWLDAAVVTIGDTVLLTIADDYASADYRRSCDAEIDRITRECSELIGDGMSELDRAVNIVAYIVKGMEYAYESDGVTPVSSMWAHNMTGFAVYQLGVCEAYAKTFMYLCLLNGVECAMGSGFAGGEAHAWNYVKIGDEWYGADITWTDNSGDIPVYDRFGLSESAIFADHVPHPSTPSGVDFIYEAPELSKTNIELTALYKDGEYLGMYKSIDSAFAAMTDNNAEYLVDIGFYSAYIHEIEHTLYATETPAVKKLTVLGKSVYLGEAYLDNNTAIHVVGDITLGSDLELRNVHLLLSDGVEASVIDLHKHSLILGGESVYLQSRVEGNYSYSSVIAATERGAYIYGGVDVHRLVVKTDKIVFGADSVIEYSGTVGIYTTNGANLVIKHYE